MEHMGAAERRRPALSQRYPGTYSGGELQLPEGWEVARSKTPRSEVFLKMMRASTIDPASRFMWIQRGGRGRNKCRTSNCKKVSNGWYSWLQHDFSEMLEDTTPDHFAPADVSGICTLFSPGF
jgi:hypothetical protein